MVVSPCPSHSFGIPVVWHDVVVVGEFFMADGDFLSCSTILRFSSFRISVGDRSSRYSPRVMRIFDTLHTEPYDPGSRNELAAAAGKGFVYRTEFVAAKPHGGSPMKKIG